MIAVSWFVCLGIVTEKSFLSLVVVSSIQIHKLIENNQRRKVPKLVTISSGVPEEGILISWWYASLILIIYFKNIFGRPNENRNKPKTATVFLISCIMVVCNQPTLASQCLKKTAGDFFSNKDLKKAKRGSLPIGYQLWVPTKKHQGDGLVLGYRKYL